MITDETSNSIVEFVSIWTNVHRSIQRFQKSLAVRVQTVFVTRHKNSIEPICGVALLCLYDICLLVPQIKV